MDFTQLEPQKNAFFSDFGSDLQENGEFGRSKCFLEVAVKFKELQFTFSELDWLSKLSSSSTLDACTLLHAL